MIATYKVEPSLARLDPIVEYVLQKMPEVANSAANRAKIAPALIQVVKSWNGNGDLEGYLIQAARVALEVSTPWTHPIFPDSSSAKKLTQGDVNRLVEVLEKKNHYEVLGVRRYASKDEITAAYRALVRAYGSDVLHAVGIEAKVLHQILNSAYVVLRDPYKRERFGGR